MADISKVKIEDTTYELKDTWVREQIEKLIGKNETHFEDNEADPKEEENK